MSGSRQLPGVACCILLTAFASRAADVVPNEIQQPGTQPGEIGNLESPDKCDNCHGGYNSTVEPAHNWRGSMMANASRDPLFWATLAVAEQDFDGVGDLCLRCHTTAGWLGGRSTPTDGSGLAAQDADGVECDFCHKLTNPDDSEFLGVQNPPFVANDGGNPAAGYYGTGISSLWPGNEKLGPYDDAAARHQFSASRFHRDVDFCGTCHDVSNPAVGDLAHNNGAQSTGDPVLADGAPGGPVELKAAFNNFPYMYGIVERTFSEFKSGLLSRTPVSEYWNLPPELRAGAIQAGYESALVAGAAGDYRDQTVRYYSCQTCHMRPVQGAGCNKKGAPIRSDLPLHDMTGGNYWVPAAIEYLDSKALLRLGGDLTSAQLAALHDGKVRAQKQLREAISIVVEGNTVRVTNLTGHKVISGYPEGRRMWLNLKWYDTDGGVVREDGAYGALVDELANPVTVVNPATGQPTQVESIIDLHDPNTRIYEAHYGLTQEWAGQLLALGYPTDLPLGYDRYSGNVDETLGDLAGAAPGTVHESFHFALNNEVVKDNRIPPYGMSYEEARKRNALPVPADQYGGVPGGVYDHWDELTLHPPPDAVYATIDMLYQPTSWEYIQFLYLANEGTNAFLADEGVNLLDAWLNTGMAAPYIMTSTTWGSAPTPPVPDVFVSNLTTWSVDKKGNPVAPSDTFSPRDTVGIEAMVVDGDASTVAGAQVFVEVIEQGGGVIQSLQGFSDDAGVAFLKWKTDRSEAPGVYAAVVADVIVSGYQFVVNPLGDRTDFIIQ